MRRARGHPIVHLELHTSDQTRACEFYSELLDWRPERICAGSASYVALELGGQLGGGIVECAARSPVWLPYVEVERVDRTTQRADELGASVLLAPRRGPSGWRSVIGTPDGGEIALWQRERRWHGGSEA